MLSSIVRPLVLAGFISAVSASTPLQADFKDDIDFAKLKAEYGSSLPSGAGVRVVQIEYIRDGAWAPDTRGDLSGKALTYRTNFFGGIAEHALNVANYLLGNTTSITPGVAGWGSWEATSFMGRASLNGGRSIAPLTANWDIENHSWGGSDGLYGENILDKMDFRIDRDQVISLAGVDNYASSTMSMLMANYYNGISVGSSTGDHAVGSTMRVSGRMKPDLVGTRNWTSYATPIVASCATLLVAEINRTPSLAAARAPYAIKALLLAGATKDEFPEWKNSSSRPLDVIYGAGEVNIYNSYKTLLAGKQSGNVATTGWDAAETGGGRRLYYFEVPSGQSLRLSAILTWHRVVTPDALWLYCHSSLTNLDLVLWQVDGGGQLVGKAAESTSSVDNVEHVFERALPAGRYALEVASPAQGQRYGLAWHGVLSGTPSAPSTPPSLPPPPPPPAETPAPAPAPVVPSGNFADSGFESVSVGWAGTNAFRYQPTGSAWSFSGDAGISGNNSGFTSGNAGAPEGGQVGFIQRQGNVSQRIHLSAGTYRITAKAAQRVQWQKQNQSVKVEVDGAVVGTLQPSSGNYSDVATDNFAVGDGEHTVRFVGTASDDGTLFLDQVQIASPAAPAPAPAPAPEVPTPAPSAPAPAAGTFVESSFEGFSVGRDDFSAFRYTPSMAGWTFNGMTGIAGNNSGFTSANPGAPAGTQVAFIQMQGSLSQSVELGAGTYTISALVAQRGSYQMERQTVQIHVDGRHVGTFNPSGTNYVPASTDAFTVTAGAHTIRFSGTAWSDGTMLVDELAVKPATTSSPAEPGSAVSVADAGFESPSVGSGRFDAFAYNPWGASWTFEGSSGVTGNGSGFTASNAGAPQGTQVAFVQMNNSVISQSISFGASGNYVLSVSAAQRGQWNQQNQIVNVYLDDAYVGSIAPTNTSYQTFSFNFSTTAGSHRLSFRGTAQQDGTVFLDSVSIR